MKLAADGVVSNQIQMLPRAQNSERFPQLEMLPGHRPFLLSVAVVQVASILGIQAGIEPDQQLVHQLLPPIIWWPPIVPPIIW